MPTELKKLTLTELSLVDRPANPLAMAPIFKADSNGDKMTDKDKMEDKIKAYMKEKGCGREEAMKALGMKKSAEELEAELEKATADLEKSQSENEKLRKSLLDEGYKITKEGIEKKADAEFIEVEGEQILKSDIPAAILKRLEAAEVEKREAAIEKQAKETLPNFDENVAKALVALDLDEEVLKVLKAADALFESQMTEKGRSSNGEDLTDPNEQLNALAKAYATEHKMTFAKAYSEVVKTDEGKALTKAIYKKD